MGTMRRRHSSRRQTNKRDPGFPTAGAMTISPDATPNSKPRRRVMNKIALVSIALAMLATTPALARVRYHEQNHWQVDHGYQPSQVRPGDVPFAPF
jgi:hypothetical protein